MAFYVGQKVVCVGGENWPGAINRERARELRAQLVEIGGIYTVRAINDWPSVTLLRFYGVDNSHLVGVGTDKIEPGWPSWGFRPVVERPTSIEIFKRMLVPSEREKAGA